MSEFYPDPVIGPIVSGKQTISLYDEKTGSQRTIIATPGAVDRFMSNRSQSVNSAAKRGWLEAAVVTLLGTGIGAAVNSYIEVNKAKLLNSYADKLNDELSYLQDGETAWDKSCKLLKEEPYKKYNDKLFHLYNYNIHKFIKNNLKEVAKEAGKSGAIVTGALTASCAVFIPWIKAAHAEQRITQDFLKTNK